MQFAATKLPWKRLGTGIFSLALLMALGFWAISDSNNSRLFVPAKHETAHVHDHGDLAWPPHPRNMNEVVDFSKPGEDHERKQHKELRFGDVERENKGHATFRRALGNKFTRVAVIDNNDKHNPNRSEKYVYFSRDNNATVEVSHDGNQIVNVKSTPAGDYQPEITEEEISEAIQLAKAHFANKGYPQAAALKGYGILAYPPEGRVFYPTRVIYISLHTSLDAPPSFMAWVDLTNASILKSREEK
jgi:hypothetical protein